MDVYAIPDMSRDGCGFGTQSVVTAATHACWSSRSVKFGPWESSGSAVWLRFIDLVDICERSNIGS